MSFPGIAAYSPPPRPARVRTYVLLATEREDAALAGQVALQVGGGVIQAFAAPALDFAAHVLLRRRVVVRGGIGNQPTFEPGASSALAGRW